MIMARWGCSCSSKGRKVCYQQLWLGGIVLVLCRVERSVYQRLWLGGIVLVPGRYDCGWVNDGDR